MQGPAGFDPVSECISCMGGSASKPTDSSSSAGGSESKKGRETRQSSNAARGTSSRQGGYGGSGGDDEDPNRRRHIPRGRCANSVPGPEEEQPLSQASNVPGLQPPGKEPSEECSKSQGEEAPQRWSKAAQTEVVPNHSPVRVALPEGSLANKKVNLTSQGIPGREDGHMPESYTCRPAFLKSTVPESGNDPTSSMCISNSHTVPEPVDEPEGFPYDIADNLFDRPPGSSLLPSPVQPFFAHQESSSDSSIQEVHGNLEDEYDIGHLSVPAHLPGPALASPARPFLVPYEMMQEGEPAGAYDLDSDESD